MNWETVGYSQVCFENIGKMGKAVHIPENAEIGEEPTTYGEMYDLLQEALDNDTIYLNIVERYDTKDMKLKGNFRQDCKTLTGLIYKDYVRDFITHFLSDNEVNWMHFSTYLVDCFDND